MSAEIQAPSAIVILPTVVVIVRSCGVLLFCFLGTGKLVVGGLKLYHW
jgi:hypothetical protein